MSESHSLSTLPTFTLKSGFHQVEVFDPRPQPEALGARYVHGGYIKEWSFQGVPLTDRPQDAWSSYEGCGLPEVFEWGLGWGDAEPGQPFLRIGAGRMLKQDGGFHESGGPLIPSLDWEILQPSPQVIHMKTQDEIAYSSSRVAYTLEREVELFSEGVRSHTTLAVESPWNTPVSWFPHPFLAQSRLDETGLTFAQAMERLDGTPLENHNGRLSYPAGLESQLSRYLPTSLQPFEMTYQSSRFTVEMKTSYPTDHVVLFGTPRVISAEPQFSRTWPSGHTSSWTVEYRLASTDDESL